MRNEVLLKTFGMGYVKMHGFHGNPFHKNWKWEYA